jgi:hypothetical protein
MSMMRKQSAAAVVGALAALMTSAAVAAPAARATTAPQPVSNLQAFQRNNDVVVIEWTKAPDADEAVLCWNVGDTAPTSPVPTATTSCNPPTTNVSDAFQGDQSATYSVSVFSYRSSDAAYGTPVSAQYTVDGEVADVTIAATGAVNAHSLALRWDVNQAFDDSDDSYDVTSWVIRDRRGTTPPSMNRQPVKIVSSNGGAEASAIIGGLTPGVPYTFTVVAEASGGRVGRPDSTVAATRVAGDRVGSLRHGRWSQHLLAGSDGLAGNVAARVQSTGRTEALYTAAKVNPGHSSRAQVRLVAGKAGAGWAHPTTVYGKNISTSALQLARSPDGTLVAAWQDNSATALYRIRPAGSHWRSVHRLPAFISEFLAITVDGRDRIHALVDQNRALEYATYANGSWSFRHLGAAARYGDAAIAYDRSRNRVVVATVHTSHAGTVTLGVASASASAKRLGRRHVVVTRSLTVNGTHGTTIDTPSVAAANGRIVVGATLINQQDNQRAASQPVDHGVIRSRGLVVATGSSAAHMGRPVVVRGTGATDSGLRVTLAGPRRLVAVWTRRTSGFKASDGAYELVAHARGAHSWWFGKAHRVLAGHYTFAVVGALPASGRPVVVTRTLSTDTIVDE